MLSSIDIKRYIGKEINIVPLIESNIKENSINFSSSDMAWKIEPSTNGNYKKAKSVCKNGKITLEPHSTTLIYTNEVIALSNKLGGTFHAKVGVVSKGVVFCSTMIGPGYFGHLLITVQNPTDNDIQLTVGETFISLILYKLKTPLAKSDGNSNSGGHLDKLSYYSITLSNEERSILDEEWKKKYKAIKEKTVDEPDYKKIVSFNRKLSKPYYFVLVLFSIIIFVVFYLFLRKYYYGEEIIKVIVSAVTDGLLTLVLFLSGWLRDALYKVIIQKMQ